MSTPQVDSLAWSTPWSITKTLRREPYPAISPDNESNSVEGKIIIITGAGVGIGAAAAKVWARAHAAGVVLAARRLETLEKVAAEIREAYPSTKVLAVATDVAVEADVVNLFAQVQATFGRPADVVLNNAGTLRDDDGNAGDQTVDQWWDVMTVNLKGLYAMSHHFIRSQKDPKNPVGTIITVGSGRASVLIPGGSAYNVSKLAEQRLNEHLQLEYPNLRVFTTMPGIVETAMVTTFFAPYAKDHVDLTGMLALYLSQPRADFLKGAMVGVNWDVEELEQHKERIEKDKLLKLSWLPIIPFEGGKGL